MVKIFLICFVILSILIGVYKAIKSPCCDVENSDILSSDKESVVQITSSSESVLKSSAFADKTEAKSKADSASSNLQAKKTKKAIVYYFYTSIRCYSCTLIENYIREAVEQNFNKPYNGWIVEFKGVNVELGENRHFIKDYWLNSKSVVVQKFEDQKLLEWIILKDVWLLLGNKSLFINYVNNEIKKFLDKE
ncbi:MAG: nitrophenyl compound nitroreductase subunit ArsF family protein [Elusimicrobiota bacterium]